MSNDPALEAHDHTEHAAHAVHTGDSYISRVSITIAVLAVMAAAAGSLETVEGGRAITQSSYAVLAQDQATDSWNEYQADSLKRHMYEIALNTVGLGSATYRQEIEKENMSQDQARRKALAAEKQRDLHLSRSAKLEERHHWLTGSATIIEIGIALATVAIITRRRPFWFSAIGLGALGLSLFAVAYFIV